MKRQELEKKIWRLECRKIVIDEVVKTLSKFQERKILWEES
jgi:hypothetical protein